ncbi:hypothetical protein BU16DRAFT_545210 [Lophium mytilinum]|uniref:Uncharacterized protein n=1 Tax=Lophium mytilinum TaxID=390894 RepID=A0A6A6Q8J2_9PEZI|nr:hypothetical protein BU16DRAFT_545210 [Lophium mytilinum]
MEWNNAKVHDILALNKFAMQAAKLGDSITADYVPSCGKRLFSKEAVATFASIGELRVLIATVPSLSGLRGREACVKSIVHTSFNKKKVAVTPFLPYFAREEPPVFCKRDYKISTRVLVLKLHSFASSWSKRWQQKGRFYVLVFGVHVARELVCTAWGAGVHLAMDVTFGFGDYNCIIGSKAVTTLM